MDIYQETQRFFESVKTEKVVIGKSLFKRDIYAVKIGEGSPVGIVQYAIHAREYITAKLAPVHYKRGVAKGSVWLLPLVNPDGALLSQIGITTALENRRDFLLSLNGGNHDFSLWKANGRGVDLNVNFPARWGTGGKNLFKAGAENFVGAFPFSEPETLALRNFTIKIRPDYTVSYHTKGEEIYWYFYQSTHTCPRDFALAKVLSKATGYPLGQAKGSAGGYKDWCVQSFSIPSFTIESGADKYSHPLKEKAFQDIKKKNKDAIYRLSKEV